MSKVSAQARQELIEATRDRYLASSPLEKRRILDEFVTLTGWHRKHAIRVLRSQRPEPVSRSPRPRIYGEAVREALVVLWEASNRACGKRLKPLLPALVPALEHHGHLSLDEAVRSRVLAVSAATIDRLLAGKRAAAPVRATLDPRRKARPTDRAGPQPPRSWRTRVDPFDGVWPRVVAWLEAEPDRTAKELLQRLRDEGLGQFPDRQLRTFQRRVKEWRRFAKPV
jgi:hypothetical protein